MSELNDEQLKRDGFAVFEGYVSETLLRAGTEAIDLLPTARAGLRDPLSQSTVLRQIEEFALRPIATRLLGASAFPVRSILFDKTPEANWDVVWHQDVTIAVRERVDVAGFGPWSVKMGVAHVQPPSAVLEQMVTLRLHFDACPPQNGPLLVVPASHTRGFIDVRTLNVTECDRAAIACTTQVGGLIAMRPLILHASKKATEPGHRRVLHVEYACRPLPGGLEWNTSVETRA